MNRRDFSRLCTSLLAGAAALSRSTTASTEALQRTLLVNRDRSPLLLSQLEPGSSLIFHYPFVTTPCFLIRLSEGNYNALSLSDHSGGRYEWPGGVGPDGTLVAFSAICSHKMTHPSKPISHINFRTDKRTLQNSEGKEVTLQQSIVCCSEHSTYDPAQGARVISGPATQPLAAIVLETDADDQIHATGMRGGSLLDPFLQKFGFRLALEHNVSDPKSPAGSAAVAVPAADYSAQQIQC